MRSTVLRFAAPATLLLALGCSDDPGSASTAAATSTSATSSSSSGSGGAGGSPLTGEIAGEVTRYDFAFDLEAATATARATFDVAPPGGDCATLSCELPGLDTVTFGDAPASFAELTGGALHACGAPVASGPLAIEVTAIVPEDTFHGLDIGFSRTTDMDGGEFTYLLSWVEGCRHFGPCDADPSKLAAFHFEIAHPSGSTVLCPGVLTPGDTTTRCDLEGTLAPTYSAFAFASDPLWVKSSFVTAAGVDLVFYEVPSGKLAASLDPASAKEFFEWLTALLGPFPYGDELRIAGGPTAWLGFEHPANIILAEDMPDLDTAYADTTMHVFMHEVIHQWAGDRTTLATSEDFVWKEATAEYLAYVFEDEHRDPEEAASSLAYWDSIAIQSGHYPRPTDEPPPDVAKFYGDVYGPGPMVLYVQLESMIGRPAVLAAIATFLAEAGARSVVDLQVALEQAAGADLDAYFDAWVFGAGAPEWPTLAVATDQVGDQVTVTLTQQNGSGKLYGCAVDVEVQGATTSARAKVDFGLAPASATATATVTLAEPVVTAVLDPDHRLVARKAGAAAAPLAPRRVWIL